MAASVHLHVVPAPSTATAAALSTVHAQGQKSTTTNAHRPSPYMRRVRLPRLNFGISNGNGGHFRYADGDDDLPSPEELMAKIELIHLKNQQMANCRHKGESANLNGNNLEERGSRQKKTMERTTPRSHSVCPPKTNSGRTTMAVEMEERRGGGGRANNGQQQKGTVVVALSKAKDGQKQQQIKKWIKKDAIK